MLSSFDYAVLRVVPRVDREEFLNAGVILFCLSQDFLAAQVALEDARLRAVWPTADLELIRSHLNAFVRVSRGAEDGGPIARLSKRERFHWLVAPRSTIIQVSPVHSGLCENANAQLQELFRQLVEITS